MTINNKEIKRRIKKNRLRIVEQRLLNAEQKRELNNFDWSQQYSNIKYDLNHQAFGRLDQANRTHEPIQVALAKYGLSDGELLVAKLLSSGLTRAEIASETGRPAAEVAVMVGRIRDKVGVV